ncbi:MAG: VCBS repeat-containing protein [Chitinophagaceae bacterium]
MTRIFPDKQILIPALLLVILMASCHSKKETPGPMFEALDSKRTGLVFSNNLSYNQQFNLFKYIYFYNGSGVGAGDFNNDGLTDLFFGSNQSSNRLFLNTGGLKFRDVTPGAGIVDDGGWTTGISVVDINNDGLLDLYVCRVGQYEVLHSSNQLLVNQGLDKKGVPVFKEMAKEYGLDFSGFSTHAAFLDYDLDGDLDMLLLNHSVHENGTFKPRGNFLGTYHPLSGDRFYRNDNGRYTDVTKETTINSSAISYGLGIAVSDIDLDGYPDVYIGNDFHENDYLYINQRNGTFRDEGEQRLQHTSQYSMGVDVADINNDAYPEIISMDMLPEDPYILKRSLGEDAFDIFNYKISSGYSHQYTRNNLQYNRRDGQFSEIGLYSGVAATDWSWAPLWFDFDNDGYKDLFISNGIPKRMNDIDYINFVSNSEIQQRIQGNNMGEKDLALINKFPEIKLPNKFYRNNKDLSFTDEGALVTGQEPSFSNGAVYADLDNDGDLDAVVNNIDAPAVVYENKHQKDPARSSIRISLHGQPGNVNALGAKILVYQEGQVRTYDKSPVKGFMSSMEVPLLVAFNRSKTDSIVLIWPDNSCELLGTRNDSTLVSIKYRTGLPAFDYQHLRTRLADSINTAVDITALTGLNFLHRENHFVEFDREPLIPHMMSTEGPAIAVGDINNDKLDDIYIGSARDGKSGIYLQDATGKFVKTNQPAIDRDSSYENTDAIWVDVNKDGFKDLVVASGGNEFFGIDYHNMSRVYLNDGRAGFTAVSKAFGNVFMTASCIVANDFNNDGFPDIFIGARAVPYAFGKRPPCFLFQNDGTGKFKDVTNQYMPELKDLGFVTYATWADLDKNGKQDLLVSLDWGGLYAFVEKDGRFSKQAISEKNGWWNFIYPYDLDNDGDLDLVAGNLGLNSRLRASADEPVRMYYNDFDGNGKSEQVMTYYLQGREIPFANKSELERQIPALKKKFLYAEDFAKASLKELFGAEKLKNAEVLTADYFSNSILINQGNGKFEVRAMPVEAQFSPYRDAAIVNANNDALPDVLLFGNYYDNNIQMGRYDADAGTILVNKGGGNFEAHTMNGLAISGQTRHIRKITINNQEAFVLARNDDSTRVIRFNGTPFLK